MRVAVYALAVCLAVGVPLRAEAKTEPPTKVVTPDGGRAVTDENDFGDFAPAFCVFFCIGLAIVGAFSLFLLVLGLFVAYKVKSDSAPAPRHFKG